MEIVKKQLTSLIEGLNLDQLKIPVYQRNYNWGARQCELLFSDLLRVIEWKRNDRKQSEQGRSDLKKYEHFFGNIICYNNGHNLQYIIDGQQRLTSVCLLLAAINNLVDSKRISFNEDGDNKLRAIGAMLRRNGDNGREVSQLELKNYKNDQAAFLAILNLGEDPSCNNKDSNIRKNYDFFLKKIIESNVTIDDLFDSLGSLIVSYITLDHWEDPQIVFESINSKGLKLTEADKARNYMLMTVSDVYQEDCYKNYWQKIECNADGKVDDFLRWYLEAKTGKTVVVKRFYQTFCNYVDHRVSHDDVSTSTSSYKNLFEEMLRYSKHYHNYIGPHTECDSLDEALSRIWLFGAKAVIPYVLNLLDYRYNKHVSDKNVVDILLAIDSSVFRRWAKGDSISAKSRFFTELHSKAKEMIDNDAEYSDAVKYLLINEFGCPEDEAFRAGMSKKNCYKINNNYKQYLFSRLETLGNKEGSEAGVVKGLVEGKFSIEHVMPQALNKSWIEDLGSDYSEIHAEWCNRLANLTLTAYNQQYGSAPFSKKRDMPHGFKESHFKMNEWIAARQKWGVEELVAREKMLEEQILSLWPMPTSNYVKTDLKEVSLGDSYDFCNSVIVAFRLFGERYTYSKWRYFERDVLKVVSKQKAEELSKLADNSATLNSGISRIRSKGSSGIGNSLFVVNQISIAGKIDLLREVFKACGISLSDLVIEIKSE